MTAMQMKRFRACRASEEDTRSLCASLDRESRRLGTHAQLRADGRISLRF